MTTYCRLEANSAQLTVELSPTTFGIHIPVAAVSVSGSNPFRMRAWRLFPPARLPAVGSAIPVVVATHPDVIPAWSNRTMLADADRGTKLDYDLRMSGYSKGNAK